MKENTEFPSNCLSFFLGNQKKFWNLHWLEVKIGSNWIFCICSESKTDFMLEISFKALYKQLCLSQFPSFHHHLQSQFPFIKIHKKLYMNEWINARTVRNIKKPSNNQINRKKFDTKANTWWKTQIPSSCSWYSLSRRVCIEEKKRIEHESRSGWPRIRQRERYTKLVKIESEKILNGVQWNIFFVG